MSKHGTKSTYCEHCGDFHDPLKEYVSSVKVGETIPDYEFEAYQGGAVREMKLSDFRGSWLVLMFYPADFSDVCPTELKEMASLYGKVKAAGVEVISFSTDSVFAHKAWHESSEDIKQIAFPMGADPSGKISYAFGTLIEGEETELQDNEGLSLRGTFIVDASGVLRSMEIIDNAVGRSAAETLRKLEALRHVETNPGNVCPAGWQPGEKAFKAS